MPRVTLQQVAEYAGVSRRTVDRVINGRGNVRPGVAERVLDAVKVLGYERNKVATALASSQYYKRVCMLHGLLATKYLEDKVAGGIRRAEEELRDYGIEVEEIVVDTQSAEAFSSHLEQIVEEDYSGLAIFSPYNDDVVRYLNRLADRRIPVVTFNSDIPGSRRTCFVGENFYLSGQIAGNIMARLLRKGEKIVAGCGFSYFEAHRERLDGFVSEITKYGIPEKDLVYIQTEQDYTATYGALVRCFEEHNDIRGIYMAVEPNAACADFLTGNRAKVPQRPYVVCHDIDPTTTRYLKEGVFDFVVDQDVGRQYELALLYLKDSICFGISQRTTYSTSQIYNAAYFMQDA